MKELTLIEIQQLLNDSLVLVGPEDDRNPVVIAAALGIVSLAEIERVETGFFNGVDKSRMLTDGWIVEPIALGQRVLQAVTRDILQGEI